MYHNPPTPHKMYPSELQRLLSLICAARIWESDVCWKTAFFFYIPILYLNLQRSLHCFLQTGQVYFCGFFVKWVVSGLEVPYVGSVLAGDLYGWLCRFFLVSVFIVVIMVSLF